MYESEYIYDCIKRKEDLVSIEQNENIIKLNRDLYIKQSLYDYFKKVDNQRILLSRNKRLSQYYNNQQSKDKEMQLTNVLINSNSNKSIAEPKKLPYLYSQQHINKVRSMPKMAPLGLRKQSKIYDIILESNTKGYRKPFNAIISSLDFNNIVTRQDSNKVMSESHHTKSSNDIFLSNFNSIDNEFPKKLREFIYQNQYPVKKSVEKQLNKMNNPVISFNFCEKLLQSITRRIYFYNQKNEFLKEEEVANLINDEMESFFNKNTLKSHSKTISYLDFSNKNDLTYFNRTNELNNDKEIRKKIQVKILRLSKSYENINQRKHPITTMLDTISHSSCRSKNETKKRIVSSKFKSRNKSILVDSYRGNKENEEQIIKQIIEEKKTSSLHSLLSKLCKNNFSKSNNNKINTNANTNFNSNYNKNHSSREQSNSYVETNNSNLLILKSRPFNQNNGNKSNNDDIFGNGHIKSETTMRKTTKRKLKKNTLGLNKKSASSINVHIEKDINKESINELTTIQDIKRKNHLSNHTSSKSKKKRNQSKKASFYEGQMLNLLATKEELKKQKEFEEKKKQEEEQKRKVEEYMKEINEKYEREKKKKQDADFKEYAEKMKEEERKFSILRKQEEIQKEIDNPDWLAQTMFYQVFNQSNSSNDKDRSNNINQKKIISAIQEVTCSIPDHLLFSHDTLSPSSINEEEGEVSKNPSINMLSPINNNNPSPFPSLETINQLNEEGEIWRNNDNALNSDKKRKILLLRLKNSINFALSKKPLTEKGEKMFNEFKEKLDSLKQIKQEDYVKNLEDNYNYVQDELGNMEKLKEDERRINLFVNNLKLSLDNAVKTNLRNKIKVVDYKFKTFASSLLLKPDE